MDKIDKHLASYKYMFEIQHIRLVLLAIVFVLGTLGEACAFEIPTGNEDIIVNWDNSARLNFGYRVTNMDEAIAKNPNLNDGDLNFKNGFSQSRLDILSELDISYKRDFGIRVSGAGWFDESYQSLSHQLSDETMERYGGPGVELLDAFVYDNFTVANIPVEAKLGRHTLFWGEGLGGTAAMNGISYGQSPLDFQKGYAVPNSTAKELFRPLFNASATVQPFHGLSICGQYFMQWEADKYPEDGTYLGPYNYLMDSGKQIIEPPLPAGLGTIQRGDDITPSNFSDWGISARWSPSWLFGTMGFYFRNFADKLPQVHISMDPLMSGDPAQYHFAYASDIKLYGISLSKQILGISVGAEFSYRENMPLLSTPVLVASNGTAGAFGLSPGSYSTRLPTSGNTDGALGDTEHGLINFLGLINKTPLFDSASWTVEFNWSEWVRVTQNKAVFEGNNSYTGIDRVTKDATAVDLSFTPTWFQVITGVDLSLPLSFGEGLTGNSACSGVSEYHNGYWTAGLEADIHTRYLVDLTYTGYFGNLSTDNGVESNNNGDYALLHDRGTLYLTLRATF